MTTTPELKPCPFCGSGDIVYRKDDVAYLPPAIHYALCRGCGASGANTKSGAEAIAAWNRRAAPEGWRPIASAPRDGTEILVAYASQGFVKQLVYYSKVAGYWMSKGEPKLGLENNATHWMSLPPKPEVKP